MNNFIVSKFNQIIIKLNLILNRRRKTHHYLIKLKYQVFSSGRCYVPDA